MKKINMNNNDNNKIDKDNENSDSEISLLEDEDYDEENELLPILTIPRIRPNNEEHLKLIKDKLKKDEISIQKIDKEIEKEEEEFYVGSFSLYDNKNNIKIATPCYKENNAMKQFLKEKDLQIKLFKTDFDIDTDEDLLSDLNKLNNKALDDFAAKLK